MGQEGVYHDDAGLFSLVLVLVLVLLVALTSIHAFFSVVIFSPGEAGPSV